MPDSLATWLNLHRRLLLPLADCPFCHQVPKDSSHLFISYPFAKEVWNCLGFTPHKLFSKALDWRDCLLFFSQQQHHGLVSLELIVIILWYIWDTRNDLIFRNKGWQAPILLDCAKDFLQTYTSFNVPTAASTASPVRPICKNVKLLHPERGQLKLNVDAAFPTTAVGYDYVLWDDHGTVLCFGVGPMHDNFSTIQAEAMAIHLSLLRIQDDPSSSLVLETDCLGLVTQLQST